MRIYKNFALGLAALFVFVPVMVSAHATGPSIEKEVNGYTFDIGYSDEPVALETVRFDLSLLKSGSEDEVDFRDAWVRISDGNETVFAGAIARTEFGEPGLSVIFPKGGTYSMLVRFENEKGPIVESEFPVKVSPASSQESNGSPIALSIAALVVGALGGFFLGVIRKGHA